MRTTLVGLCLTQAMKDANVPALTPELLAASGARYSRNNEGLPAILAKIDPDDPDKSVSSIFKMVDYGHQSIADMAPVAMFMDDISLYLAFLIWELCPLGNGQESSTRYIEMSRKSLVHPKLLGIPDKDHKKYYAFAKIAFAHYKHSLEIWTAAVKDNPKLLRIPSKLLKSTDEKDVKKVDRMTRNYAFDRARYSIPVGASTNMMLTMSAREWVGLTSTLLSHYIPEARKLGKMIAKNLKLVVPHLVKHAVAKDYIRGGIRAEFQDWRRRRHSSVFGSKSVIASLECYVPKDVSMKDIVDALAYHENRYAKPAKAICRILVRFSLSRVTIAELRDLNRHRTGTKEMPRIPCGCYLAEDQYAHGIDQDFVLEEYRLWGEEQSRRSLELLTRGRHDHVFWGILGTQYSFEHNTTADKFLYEAELRTGIGAHYRYSEHLHDLLVLWYKQFPGTSELILEGTTEPE